MEAYDGVQQQWNYASDTVKQILNSVTTALGSDHVLRAGDAWPGTGRAEELSSTRKVEGVADFPAHLFRMEGDPSASARRP